MQNLQEFQEESRLIVQRGSIVADITENQSKIKSLQRDIKKHEKQLEKSRIQLDKINKVIENSKTLYKTAFVYILKNDYDGDVMGLFDSYDDQTSLVERYTILKCSEALKVYLIYSIKHLKSWEDLINIHNLATTNKELYAVLKTEIYLKLPPEESQEIPKTLPLCSVHLYPINRLYTDINWCYEKLSGNLDYENPVFYIKVWRKRVKTLLMYWNVSYEEIPSVPGSIPYQVREQLTADEEDTTQEFQQNMEFMNEEIQNCADAAKLGIKYDIPVTNLSTWSSDKI